MVGLYPGFYGICKCQKKFETIKRNSKTGTKQAGTIVSLVSGDIKPKLIQTGFEVCDHLRECSLREIQLYQGAVRVCTNLCFDVFYFIERTQLEAICLSSVCSSVHKVSQTQDDRKNKCDVLTEKTER